MNSWLLLSLMTVACLGSERELKLAIVIARPGARRERRVFAVNPDLVEDNTVTTGDITPVGVRQHYILGRYLYKKYKSIIQSDFENVQVFSSYALRTVASVTSLAYGLLHHQKQPNFEATQKTEQWNIPINEYKVDLSDMKSALPNGFHFFPVVSPPADQDVIFRPFAKKVCPKLNKAVEAFIEEKGQSRLPKFSTMFDLFGDRNLKGFKTTNFKGINSVCEGYLHGLYNDPDFEEFPEITVRCKIFQKFRAFLIASNKDLYKTAISPFNQFILEFTKAATSDVNPKLVILSAHDTTLLMFLSNFFPLNYRCLEDNFSNPYGPRMKNCIWKLDFASTLAIELSIDKKNGDRWIELKIDNVPLEIDGSSSMRTSAFIDRLNKNYDPDFNFNCGRFALEDKDNTKLLRFLVYSTLALVFVMINIVVVLFLVSRRKRYRNVGRQLDEDIEN